MKGRKMKFLFLVSTLLFSLALLLKGTKMLKIGDDEYKLQK